MSVLSHIAMLFTYTLAAAAIFVVPTVFSLTETIGWWLFAAFVFLGGALIHETTARHVRQKIANRRFAAFRREINALKKELTELHGAPVRALAPDGAAAATPTTMSAPASAPAAAASGVDTAVAEVKTLQTMIGRLYPAKNGTPAGPRQGFAAVLPQDRPAGAVATADADAAEALDQVREALRHDRIDLYLQPIVSLPQRKIRFYECFTRLRAGDGGTIHLAQFAEAAAKAGLSAAIDNLVLFRSVEIARKTQFGKSDAGFVCNVTRNTLDDTAFLNEFAEQVGLHIGLAARLVLEFPQTDFATKNADSVEALGRLARLGARFSIDQVDNLRLDGAALARQGVRFVKIPARMLLDELRLDTPSIDPRALKDSLDHAGVDLAVDYLESEGDLTELLDFQIDFGQGFLFGEQRIVKDRE